MKKTLVAAAFAALALIAAGCGGDESPTASATDEWADGFCTAITTWTDSLQSVTDQFSSASALSQDGLENAANDVQSSTETLVDDLRGLGRPETESGDAVESSVDELSTTLESEVANIESAAQGASGLSEIPSAITSITASLAAMSTAFSSTLQTIESADAEDELRTALEDSPACADITS